MKHLTTYKLFESEHNPYDDEPLTRSEELFGKQTRLEKQFSEIVVGGLMGDDSEYWSTFNALKGEIKFIMDENDYKGFMYRISEGENPTDVVNDVCKDLQLDEEGRRLLNKINRI